MGRVLGGFQVTDFRLAFIIFMLFIAVAFTALDSLIPRPSRKPNPGRPGLLATPMFACGPGEEVQNSP